MMKKLIMGLLLTIFLSTASEAANLFTATIMNVTAAQVQDTLIDVFTEKNFTIDTVTPYVVTFQKSFGDGIWLHTELNTVKCNLIERDGNVRLMVTQTELTAGQILRQRSINHLIPLLSEVKHILDGTPINEVRNEAVSQPPASGNEQEKELGLVIGENGKVIDIKPGSVASGNFFVGDSILEINGMSLEKMEQETIKTYIANKWGTGSSLVMLVLHDGNKEYITVKRGE